MNKTYKGWTIDFDMKPIPYRGADWTATHPDYDASYEGPEDGWVGSHPVLTAATEKELWAEIDEWHLGQDDEDIAVIEKAAAALRSIAKRHGLTYAGIGFHERNNSHGAFWAANGHTPEASRHQLAPTAGKAVAGMLAATPRPINREKAA
ncbi:hypothetical protein [Croceicoccus sp. Ery15]|uniref:hypothetical protein n=1 Tax=Croceicoccus sp. Ery15 TaxID=1703338 RepID=UPI001E502D0E|nr:hypothetical protein [Croceicoccus sp. Ery15]